MEKKNLYFFRDRVSLCRPRCPRTHTVDQAGQKLCDLPVSASRMLGLMVCATTTQPECLPFLFVCLFVVLFFNLHFKCYPLSQIPL